MKVKQRKIVLLFGLISLGLISVGFAEEKSSLCLDPLRKICTDTIKERKERKILVDNLKQEILIEATKNAEIRIEEMKKRISKIHLIKRATESFKIKNQEIMRSAKRRISEIETVVTKPEYVDKLKSYMMEAIDESNFDNETKEKFKLAQSQVLIGNFSDFIERTNLEESFWAQLLANPCGSDGLVDNAFATTIKEQKYVLVCPGFLITLSQETKNKEKFNTILHAIAHEMGHHIDNSKFGDEIYKPFLTCLSKNYSEKFNKTKKDEKFCKNSKTDKATCDLKVVTSHAGELIADEWGIKVTAIHTKKEASSIFEIEELLTQSWAKLCGSQDEGIHPAGDFRIATLLRTNPEISTGLACENGNETKKKICTFLGEI